MTIREFITTNLQNFGMWPDQAREVMNRLERSEISEPMRGRWDEDQEAYPKSLLTVLWMGAQAEGLKYIDETNPHAWFRPLFAATAEPQEKTK